MATPNAAGAAALIREYILEIAKRPAPQGSLVKALLVLGAKMLDKDIPNTTKAGDLKESIASGMEEESIDIAIMSHWSFEKLHIQCD